ncbi:MAG: pantothenate kinase, type [Acidimicrobiaceae bacterium]|jgi:type III pantothenate kinase|nr:pantothenate kinase, type [Acidimicrobiaceae bacterium]
MLLALDVGNTQTVIGVFDDAPHGERSYADRIPGELPGLAHSWRIATVTERTADEHALLITELLALSGLRVPGRAAARLPALGDPSVDGVIDGIAVSSSVPSVTAALRLTASSWFDVPLVVVGPGVKTGMSILYDDPREVGADRVVNAVAAIDLFGSPSIVVDLGTATTFDAISAAGEYLGGAIVPGIEISMDALFAHAAALRRVELVAPSVVIGRSTVESMQAGAVYGYAALVDGLCRRIEAELGPATVIATGGLAALVAPHAEMVAHHEPWLTLHGLRLVYRRNAPAKEPGRLAVDAGSQP